MTLICGLGRMLKGHGACAPAYLSPLLYVMRLYFFMLVRLLRLFSIYLFTVREYTWVLIARHGYLEQTEGFLSQREFWTSGHCFPYVCHCSSTGWTKFLKMPWVSPRSHKTETADSAAPHTRWSYKHLKSEIRKRKFSDRTCQFSLTELDKPL